MLRALDNAFVLVGVEDSPRHLVPILRTAPDAGRDGLERGFEIFGEGHAC